ncbi:MAG: hypothetical protein KGJ63_12635, partial [Pseudomonadota bacterium]|nr:hypothetical protein [Pseudomonadota bacterium]
ITHALALALANPALAARIKTTPSQTFQINDHIGGEQLDRQTARQFVQQMQAMHKLPELKSHPELMNGAVMVMEGHDPIYWVVLPDHRAIRWKAFTMTHASIGTKRCASVPIMGDSPNGSPLTDVCDGSVYGADGRLVP